MLKGLFGNTHDVKSAGVPPVTGAIPRLAAKELLLPYTDLLNKIEELAGVPREFYRRYYETAIHNYAEFVQQLPASETHHHSTAGGMLRHGLEVAMTALKLRRAHLLPAGATPEEITQKQDLWTYAIFSAALCHDVAKPAVDQSVTLYDSEGNASQWVPWSGPISASVQWYRTSFRRDRVHGLHERSSLILINFILPKEGLGWLSSDSSVFSQWVACTSGDTDQAGKIGEIVKQADHESVARNLGAEPDRQLTISNVNPLHEKLLTGLRYLLNEGELPLNRNGAAGWLVGDDLWLVSKRAIDTLRAHLLMEGHSGIPNRNDRIFDDLQQRGILVPCNDRAVWRCSVKGDDWQHELTLIQFPAGKIWIDPESRPEAFCGEVVPVEVDGAIEGFQQVSVTSESDVNRSELGKDNSELELPELLPEESDDGNLRSVEFNNNAGHDSHSTSKGGNAKSTTMDNIGQYFLDWLHENIRTGQLAIDAPGSRIYNVPEGLFLVSPAIFKDFVDRTRSELNWEHVQKRFLKLGIHTKTSDGLNVHKHNVNRVSLHGIVLSELELQRASRFDRQWRIGAFRGAHALAPKR
ncbi:MAG: TraI domain-containing protein [Methylococcaceae bacterium]|nr:TraI domain-containing protein [Methylococcaceae bacterium]